jgi:hypothetical protein
MDLNGYKRKGRNRRVINLQLNKGEQVHELQPTLSGQLEGSCQAR